jgi:cytochrome c oxidase subunit 4
MRSLLLALAALAVLTALSFGLSRADLGAAGVPVALAIAAIKAAVVAIWFMELPRASRPAWILVAVTLSFIALLCAGTVADVALR